MPTETGQCDIEVPRDRDGRCAPQLVQTRQRRLAGCDDTVLALAARGRSPRAMQAPREEFDGGEVAPTLLSTIPDAGLDAVRTWPSRPLAAVSPLLSCDALCVTSRPDGPGQTNAVSVARGIPVEGQKARLG